uniref:Uncharacterized protein n=1 Tax=Arundo donax TaxID=35708 RepID=A0A0A9AR13_ARUDO
MRLVLVKILTHKHRNGSACRCIWLLIPCHTLNLIFAI